MKVNVINEYRIEMELDEEELSDFDISYETLDYGDVNTRRFLRELAQSARELGVEADMSGRVLIEAFRIRGGCKLCFTFLPPRGKDAPSIKQLVKRDHALFCAASSEAELLCRFCKVLPEVAESSLFYYGKEYFIMLSAEPEELARCALTAEEYGVKVPENTALALARCRENGTELFKKNAVKKLRETARLS